MEQIDVNYGRLKRYDTTKPPMKQRMIFTALLRLLCGISMIGKQYKIEKINMDSLKPPYILLCNHMYFVDFHLSFIATWPHPVNNIATIDGYYRRPFLMEWIGCLCKRKFTTDMTLLRSAKKVLHEYGDILCMYPEARYSPAGTTAILPDSLGKMVKKQGVPVVVLLHHGNYLHTPFWNYRKPRKVPLYSTMKQILTAEQVESMSAQEIGDVIRHEMTYDEYKWQREQQIHITESHRAEGLHKILYQCPHCMVESRMSSHDTILRCEACGKEWEMDTLGPDKDTKLVSWIHCTMKTPAETAVGFRSPKEAKECYGKMDSMVFVSKNSREAFLSVCPYAGRTGVIYNTNETSGILALSKEEAKLPKDAFCWCGVGKIVPIKGFDRMIRIQKRLTEEGYKACLCILGEGAQKAELEKLAADCGVAGSVSFLGYQTNPYKYVAKCDLFVCASHSEGFSTAATEALIVGTPVCTVDVSGMKEMLGENNEWGIVTENDEEALYQGIRRILDDPKLLAYYKEKAAQRGRKFSTENTVRAVEEMLMNL